MSSQQLVDYVRAQLKEVNLQDSHFILAHTYTQPHLVCLEFRCITVSIWQCRKLSYQLFAREYSTDAWRQLLVGRDVTIWQWSSFSSRDPLIQMLQWVASPFHEKPSKIESSLWKSPIKWPLFPGSCRLLLRLASIHLRDLVTFLYIYIIQLEYCTWVWEFVWWAPQIFKGFACSYPVNNQQLVSKCPDEQTKVKKLITWSYFSGKHY